jgi:hypothetical protein
MFVTDAWVVAGKREHSTIQVFPSPKGISSFFMSVCACMNFNFIMQIQFKRGDYLMTPYQGCVSLDDWMTDNT